MKITYVALLCTVVTLACGGAASPDLEAFDPGSTQADDGDAPDSALPDPVAGDVRDASPGTEVPEVVAAEVPAADADAIVPFDTAAEGELLPDAQLGEAEAGEEAEVIAPEDVAGEGEILGDVAPDACVPTCVERECGDDGCGGDCGACDGGKVCQAWACVCRIEDHKACCGDAVCWFDSCGAQGDQTANCPFGCQDAKCLSCTPDCAAKVCGDDGCGGSCGTCPVGTCAGLHWTPGQDCVSGTCMGDQTVRDCNDQNACTLDACDPKQGCLSHGAPDGSVCFAAACLGLVWNKAMTCVQAQCTGGGGAQQCVDGNACTDDGCISSVGCVFTPRTGGTCDDLDPCTTGDTCLGGTCTPTGTLDCDDQNPCTVDSCEKGVGCHTDPVTDGTVCKAGTCAGLAWTGPGKCQLGTCVGGDARACDDGRTCTLDACDPTNGCSNTVLPAYCLVDGTCRGNSETNGKCLECASLKSTTAWTYVTGKACDDGNACTKQDKCQAGGKGDAGCQGTAYSCDDNLACTVDACDGQGGCTHGLQGGACLIGGKCWGDGQQNPDNPCQTCKAGLSTTDWSPVADATTCGTGTCNGLTFTATRTCVAGQCSGGGATAACDDGRNCTTDTCDPTSGCAHALTAGNCLIGGTCYSDGATNPANACQACSASTATTFWTVRSDGSQCQAGTCVGLTLSGARTCVAGQCTGGGGTTSCDDGRACTVDSCAPATGCTHVVAGGNCLIDGACVAQGQTNPLNPCQACDSTHAPTSWSNAADGAQCGAGACASLLWTSPRTCQAGQCSGGGGTASCDDGKACTTDACSPSNGCSNSLVPGRCLIGGTCYDDGSLKADNLCQACNVSASTNAWTRRADGLLCLAASCNGLSWTAETTCAAGLCAGGGATTSCDDGLSCTNDACDPATGCSNGIQAGTCLIGGYCWANGQPNPLNACEGCDTTRSSTAWSGMTDGTWCAASGCSGLNWTAQRTCVSGQCTGGGAVTGCDDGKACTTDTCSAAAGCGHALQAGNCLIGGTCYANGVVNSGNACLACATAKTTSAWSTVADGTQCLGASCNSLVWTAARTCLTGQCTGGGASSSCNDGKNCTTDTCTPATGCANALQAGNCLISGTCYTNGTANGSDACHVCTSAQSTSTWSLASDGTSCGTGGGCVQGTCCTPNDHKACSGGNVYWYDSCGTIGSVAETCPHGCTAGVCNPTFQCPTGYALIPSGTFTMGSPATEAGRNTDETQHTVTISKAFCMKTTEVTQAEWQTVIGNNPAGFATCGTTCPVESISWLEALAYCNALSVQQGLTPCYTLTGCTGTPGAPGYSCSGGATFAGVSCTGYRLPTESEWEYAARAGTATPTYNGANTSTYNCDPNNFIIAPIAWFCGNWISPHNTRPVATKQVNPWGLYDVLGNVEEWVWDFYGPYPVLATTDPTGPSTGQYHLARGGLYESYANVIRSAYRHYNTLGPSVWTGFRVALTSQ